MADSIKLKDVSENGDGSCILYTWTLTTADHTGSAARFPEWADKSVHFVSATWGGATVAMEGSNDGVDWQPVKNPASTAITATTNALAQLLEMTYYVRPRLSTVGSGASVAVNLIVRRAQPLRS